MKFFFAPLAFVAACATPLILQPAQGPGTDYPCGYTGVVCGGHECCPQYHVCGGTTWSSCPAGQCCFTGEGLRGADGGADTTPQRPE